MLTNMKNARLTWSLVKVRDCAKLHHHLTLSLSLGLAGYMTQIICKHREKSIDYKRYQSYFIVNNSYSIDFIKAFFWVKF